MPQDLIQDVVEKKRNTMKVIVISFLVFFLLVASFAVPMMLKQSIPVPGGDKETILAPKVQKIYTQEEKVKILEDLAKSVPTNTVSQTERARILKKLSSKVTTATTTLSAEDRLRILQALAESARR